jgi:hypothetical protein
MAWLWARLRTTRLGHISGGFQAFAINCCPGTKWGEHHNSPVDQINPSEVELTANQGSTHCDQCLVTSTQPAGNFAQLPVDYLQRCTELKSWCCGMTFHSNISSPKLSCCLTFPNQLVSLPGIDGDIPTFFSDNLVVVIVCCGDYLDWTRIFQQVGNY